MSAEQAWPMQLKRCIDIFEQRVICAHYHPSANTYSLEKIPTDWDEKKGSLRWDSLSDDGQRKFLLLIILYMN